MDLVDVQSTGKKSFILESGRLLITDPYYSGYSESIQSEIIDKRGQRAVTYFPKGVSYYYPEDSSWNIYRTEKGLWVALNNRNHDSIERSVNKKIFGSQIEPWFTSKSKEQQKNREMKKRGFLFSASTDVCTLLLGDQEVFGITENEFVFAHNLEFLFEEERLRPRPGVDYSQQIKSIEDGLRDSAKRNHQNIVKMIPGEYSCRSKPNGLEVNLL